MRYRGELRRRQRARWPALLMLAGVLALLFACGGLAAYETNDGLRFRVLSLLGEVRDVIAPVPANLPAPVAAGPTPSASTFTPPPTLTLSAPTETPAAAPPMVTPTPALLPRSVTLTGFRYAPQKFNNCGPDSLAINLSYWGWPGDQDTVASAIKPDYYDRNSSPIELYNYLLTQGFDAYIRVNGDLDMLKRFIAAGYPVLVEKGYTCEAGERCTGWFGHYSVFSGYDDDRQVFITQDTFRGENLELTYDYVLNNWRAFNYLYLVVFPAGPERDADVVRLLGDAADLTRNYYAALDRARQEATALSGQDAAFAWFNVGTNLAYLQDYAGATRAYDQSREIGLPYRMLFYQFGPYRAYYYTGRYQDVIDLANFALASVVGPPGLEESFYWRGQAEEAQGLTDAAIADYRNAVQHNSNFQPARDALTALGVTP